MKKLIETLLNEYYGLRHAVDAIKDETLTHEIDIRNFESLELLHRLPGGQTLFDNVDLWLTRIYETLENHGLELPEIDVSKRYENNPLGMYYRHITSVTNGVFELIGKLSSKKKKRNHPSNYATTYACTFCTDNDNDTPATFDYTSIKPATDNVATDETTV